MSDVDCDDCPSETEGGSTDYDTLFEILADRHRRILLHRLSAEEITDVATLVEEISDHVDADRAQISSTLYHTHLPKLAGTTFVDYDPRSETVRYYGHPFLEEALAQTAVEDLSDE